MLVKRCSVLLILLCRAGYTLGSVTHFLLQEAKQMLRYRDMRAVGSTDYCRRSAKLHIFVRTLYWSSSAEFGNIGYRFSRSVLSIYLVM